MIEKKFDPKNLHKLNNPQRFNDIPPDYILEKLQLKGSDIIVEIGSGTAFFSRIFLKRCKPEKIYACDISQEMVDWVIYNVSSIHPEIVPIKTEEDTVPLEDCIADLVFMINLHHELENPSLSIAEAFRILKTEGKIFIVDWKKEEMPEGPPFEIRCEPKEVKEEMLCTGFSEIAIYDELPKHFLIIGKKT